MSNIPSPVRTSTNAGNQALAYRSGAGGTPDAFGAGIGSSLKGLGGQIGQSALQIGAMVKEREQKTDRFTTLTNFSDFESEVSSRLTEMKRTADPTGKGFAAQAESEYERLRQQFLQHDVSPELKDEFLYRTEEVKKGLIADTLDFQYKAGDAYFRQGISDELNKAQIAVAADPKQMEAWRARLDETINTSDLSEIDKQDVRRKAYIGLEGVAYKGAVKESALAGGGTVTGPVGEIIDAAATKYGQDPQVLRKIAWLESRGNPNAKNPGSSAGGLFQFINSTAAKYGITDKMDAGQSADAGARLLRDNREALTKTLGREPTVGELYLAHQQGLSGAQALLRNPNAMAVDVVGKDAVVGNGGTTGMTAGEFANLWAKKAGGAPVDFAGEIDKNPAFANVPYEDRLAYRKDAENEVQAMLTQQAAASKAENAAQINDLKNSILDGTSGQKAIDDAYHSGTLADANDRISVQNLLDERNKNQNLASDTIAKLGTGIPFDPSSEKDKAGLNAVVTQKNVTTGKSILDSVMSGNQEDFTKLVVPIAQSAHDIPTAVVGGLAGMARSNNQTQALFALDALAQLQDAEPRAYDQRTDDKLAKDVALYRALKDVVPTDELLGKIRGGTSQEERQRTAILREDATKILQQQTAGVPKIDELVKDVVGTTFDQGVFGSSEHSSTYPQAALAMKEEYQTLFVDAYGQTGTVEAADKLVKQEMQRNWGVTGVGDDGLVMKYPPEKFNPTIEGNYDYIDRQLRIDGKVVPGDKPQLVSDAKTEEEARAFRAGKGPSPTYQLVVTDVNGVPHLRMGENGRPLRYGFEVTPLDKAKEQQSAVNVQKEFEYQKFMREWARAEEHQFATGTPIPKEIVDEKARLEKELDARPNPKDYPSPYNETPDVAVPVVRPSPDFAARGQQARPPLAPPDPSVAITRSQHERVRAKLKEGAVPF